MILVFIFFLIVHVIMFSCRRLKAYPNRRKLNYLSLSLEVGDYGTLPVGWRRHAKFSFTIENKFPEKLFKLQGDYLYTYLMGDLIYVLFLIRLVTMFRDFTGNPCWFDHKSPSLGFPSLLPLVKLKIVVEEDVLEVIGKSEETINPVKKIKLNDDGVGSTDMHKEISLFNGVQILPSQVRNIRKEGNFNLFIFCQNFNIKRLLINIIHGLTVNF